MDRTAWTQKRSSMEHPQCTCGRLVAPGLQMLTRRGTVRAASEGPGDLAALGVWPSFLVLPSCRQASHRTENLLLTKTVPFSNCSDFVLFGTSVGFTLVYRDTLILQEMARLNKPNQSSIWRIWRCCNCTSCRAKMSLRLNKHMSSRLPVCSSKHARKSFLKHSEEEQWGKTMYAVLKMSVC